MIKITWTFCIMFLTISLQANDKIDSLKTLLASEPENIQVLTDLAIAYHNLGVEGDKNAVKKGLEYVQKALHLDSSQAVAVAYWGSLLTLKARDSSMPWNKLKYTKEGFMQLERAVKMQSDNLNVRLVRAMNSLMVPEFMGRLDSGIADFNFIIAQVAFADWPADFKAYVYFHLGEAYQKKGKKDESKKQFRLAVQVAPDSKSGQQAQAKLIKLE